ncbi:MAG: HEPN domain-containing protein [Candidatus Hydrogenedentes bacterium]|nr:HEPN domain-containing protein [Candidatus Hydrogenedentota bacterium]
MDNARYVQHWRDTGLEDWEVARELVANNRCRHGLFFAHLALEKLLKAHVQQATHDHPPRIHNLVRLAESAGLDVESYREFLGTMNYFNLLGRYDQMGATQPPTEKVVEYMQTTGECLAWLQGQFTQR